jgi:hypothetical protein
MSDQRNWVRDRDWGGTPRKSTRLPSNPDRNRPVLDRSFWAFSIAVWIAGCVPAAVPVVGEPPLVAAPGIERWVDASAPEGGDGTPQRPFKGLAQALAPDAIIHLRSGLYAGPWMLPAGSHLIGHGEVVLYAEGEATVVTAPASASLESLSVQGGFVGMRAIGPVTLRRTHFSGHRRVAIEAEASLTVEDSVFYGSVSETRGIQLKKGAQAKLKKLRFVGAFRRAIDAEGARLEADDIHSEGPAQALHLEGSQSQVRKLTVAGGSGPAVFVAEGALTLIDASVSGHEFGLQARKAALTVQRFSSKRVQLAAIATVECTGTLTDIQAEQSGSYGGLHLLESKLKVKGVKLKQARAMGILVRRGEVKLDDVTIEQVRGDREPTGENGGDGLHLRDADVEATNIIVRDAEGVGVFATAGARVELNRFACERCRIGAVVSEIASVVTVKGLTSRGGEGPAVAVLDHATVKLEDADITAVQVPIWAECDQGARVTVKRMKSNLALPSSGCIARD